MLHIKRVGRGRVNMYDLSFKEVLKFIDSCYIKTDNANNNETLEEKPDNDIVEENEENNQNTEEKDYVNKNNENLSNSESDDLSENIVQKDFIDNPEKALNKDTNKTENENYTL